MLSPLAGTVGIELVPQTLALTAGGLHSSASMSQEQSADTPIVSAPTQEQSTDTPIASGPTQERQLQEQSHDQGVTGALGVGEPAMHGQSGGATHGDLTVTSDRSPAGSPASIVLSSKHATQQQQQQQQHSKRTSHSMDEQEDTGRDVSDDEHAVLIAASEDHSGDVPEQLKDDKPAMSKKQSAAAERQRVWYKERAVQLTILG